MDGKNYGVGEEWSLLNMLQALTNMWFFFGCIFLEGNISSLWYEFEVEDANKKTLNAHMLLRFNRAKVVTAKDVEWICYSMGGQKFPKLGFSNSKFNKWLHMETF